MSTSFLFSNQAQDIFVLDIPRSIELGNGGGRIYAARAANKPYETPEPKGKKREVFISTLPAKHVEYHELLQLDIQRAARVLRSSCDTTEWCFPRIESSQVAEDSLSYAATVPVDATRRESLPIILSSLPNDFSLEESISHAVVLNQNVCPTQIRLSGTARMLVPASCAFVLADIVYGLDLLQGYTIDSGLRFDMILMDPPWSNRSVRNGSKYSTMQEQSLDPFDCALAIVERHGTLNGYVAIWITNKAAVHSKVVKSLASLQFTLIEEWVWIKITTEGEPITPLDGVWRRPYEMLLLFHHGSHTSTPLRRYIFAVPDIHSRKPNLKELFSKLVQPAHVLEIFARNLTSGWWCMGNEVLKFQQQGTWHCWPQSSSKPVPEERGRHTT